jgi:beta-galactosidase beta subunit
VGVKVEGEAVEGWGMKENVKRKKAWDEQRDRKLMKGGCKKK